jgi:hypothetical protein
LIDWLSGLIQTVALYLKKDEAVRIISLKSGQNLA